MNANQLTKSEQKQAYDGIKTEYKNLLRNYDEVKRNDSSGVIQDELDMDMYELTENLIGSKIVHYYMSSFILFFKISDLNQELGKMKDLLNNIVQKMSSNIAERRSPSESIVSVQRRSSNGTSVSHTLIYIICLYKSLFTNLFWPIYIYLRFLSLKLILLSIQNFGILIPVFN